MSDAPIASLVRLARELAAASGETITDVVIHALRDRHDRLRRPSAAERLAKLREISDRAAAVVAGRPADMDEFYDEYGLPMRFLTPPRLSRFLPTNRADSAI